MTQAINEAARAYIKKAISSQSKQIEAAFKKMLAGSGNTLAQTLLGSLEGALNNDWLFELRTTVTPKQNVEYRD